VAGAPQPFAATFFSPHLLLFRFMKRRSSSRGSYFLDFNVSLY
jgi:hypothetical protein